MNSKNINVPIIIGGVHRSGTSLVRRILNSHSKIYCGPEVKFFKDWYNDYINDPIKHARFIQSAKSLVPEDELFQILGKAFIEIHEKAAKNANKPRWADKNPENVLYLEAWERLLNQNWLFIQVVRNPLDTLSSIIEANFKFAIPLDLDDQIEFYQKYTEAGTAYFEKHKERSYRIFYEQLVSDPEKTIANFMNWLGERIESSQLDFNSVNHQLGLEDPKIKYNTRIHNESLGRWKKNIDSQVASKILTKTSKLWTQLDTTSSYPILV